MVESYPWVLKYRATSTSTYTPALYCTHNIAHTIIVYDRCQHIGSVRGKKKFEPSSLAAESEPLLGPHLEDYWSMECGMQELP